VFFLISGLLDESSANSSNGFGMDKIRTLSYWLAKAAAKQDAQPRCFVVKSDHVSHYLKGEF
jgi:hypothetical protein